jgi:hypothetical protein
MNGTPNGSVCSFGSRFGCSVHVRFTQICRAVFGWFICSFQGWCNRTLMMDGVFCEMNDKRSIFSKNAWVLSIEVYGRVEQGCMCIELCMYISLSIFTLYILYYIFCSMYVIVIYDMHYTQCSIYSICDRNERTEQLYLVRLVRFVRSVHGFCWTEPFGSRSRFRTLILMRDARLCLWIWVFIFRRVAWS